MTISFPTDKTQPYVAANGVTYYWDSDRWRVKTYKKEDDSRLPYRLGTDKAARSGEPAIELVDAQDNYSNVKFFGNEGISCTSTIQGINVSGANLQLQIDELGVTKGKVARYIVDNIDGKPVSRPGELSTNNPFWANVVLLSFGTEDADNVLTKPMATGDIVEFVDVLTNKVGRYKITDASGAPTLVSVEYVSGNNDFAPGHEKQVYIYPQNEAGASKDYVDAQDALRLPLTGGTLSGAIAGPAFKGLKNSGPVITVGTASDNIKAIIHANGNINACKASFEGEILLNGGDDTDNLSIYPNVGNDDSAITALNGGALRFRTVSTDGHNDIGKKTHIAIEQNDTGQPLTHIYHVATPVNPDDAVSKSYCDSIAGGGVPVGSIMIWMNTTAPAGWLKLQGGNFDVAQYPKLHAYLGGTADYTSGKLPNWGGYYPGEWGSHLNDSLGKKVGQRTAMPSGGAPYHANSIPNGNTRTFNGGGGTNAYSDGIARPAITEGWDNYTRPQTVIVHYIIKHD